MATTVGPARHKADNSFDRCSIASNVWLPVRRFHVGTSAQTLTQDAGYATATDSALTYLRRPSSFAGGVHIRAVRLHDVPPRGFRAVPFGRTPSRVCPSSRHRDTRELIPLLVPR